MTVFDQIEKYWSFLFGMINNDRCFKSHKKGPWYHITAIFVLNNAHFDSKKK